MGIIIAIVVLVFALGYLCEKATNFLKELHYSKPTKLGKGFEAKLAIMPIDKKSEVCASHTNSNSDNLGM